MPMSISMDPDNAVAWRMVDLLLFMTDRTPLTVCKYGKFSPYGVATTTTVAGSHAFENHAHPSYLPTEVALSVYIVHLA